MSTVSKTAHGSLSAPLACDVVLALMKLRTIRSTRPPTTPEAVAHFIILLLVRTLLVCTIMSLRHILIVRFHIVAVSVLFWGIVFVDLWLWTVVASAGTLATAAPVLRCVMALSSLLCRSSPCPLAY